MFKILDEVCTPTVGSKYSAAIDLYAREDVVIDVGETKIIPLGVCIDADKLKYYIFDIDQAGTIFDKDPNVDFSLSEKESDVILDNFLKSHYMQLEPRSSLRAKGLQAGTGVIDMDFKQEIQLILSNPIQYIDKVIDIDEGADYIEIDYLGSPSSIEDGIKVKYSSSFKIKKGDKIAQIMLKAHKTYLMGISTEDKRVGGFGSTGN